MIKKFLTLSLAAAMIVVGVVSDSVAAEHQETYFQTVEKCKKAYISFRNNNNSKLLEEYADQYKDESSRQGFAVVCLTYAIGYEDGLSGRV